jgi:hypothetical protein
LAEEEGFPWVLSLHIFRRHSLRNTTLCLSLSLSLSPCTRYFARARSSDRSNHFILGGEIAPRESPVTIVLGRDTRVRCCVTGR